jgi:hypothetical protein
MKRLCTFIALLVGASAYAGDGTVSLSPAAIMLRGEPGQSTTQTLLLRNNTSRTLSYDLVAQDVIVRNGARVLVPAGQIPASIAATAVFSQRHVSVAAGESAAVTATFTIPPNAATRAVIALFRGTDKILRGKVTTSSSLGALLTFTLSDAVTLSADPLRVQAQTATSNLAVAQTCTNSGSEPLVAKGMLAVIGSDGRIAGKAVLQSHRLLPGERAQLGAQYAAELQPGRYRVLVTYDYEGRALTQSTEITIQ